MADKFEIKDKLKIDPTKLEEARSYEENLQQLGRSLIASLYMLVRNVRLYDPKNEIFAKPLVQLMDCINNIISLDGKLMLQGAGNTFYLNNMLLRFDSRSFENVRQLSLEFEKHDVGGFELDKFLTIEELQNFIFIFRKEKQDKGVEREVAARQLEILKVTRHEKIKEILKGKQVPTESIRREELKLERKRYSMLLYARTVQFMRKYIQGIRGLGSAVPRANASQLIQDLVDIIQSKSQHFVGMSTATDPWDAFCFHCASVATLSVVFGSALRLTRDQLRELGLAALFHDIGRVTPKQLLPETATSSADDRKKIQIQSVKTLLMSGPLNRTNIHSILAAYDCQSDFAGLGRGPHRLDLGLFSKIVALADCYDIIASNDTTDTKVIMEMMSTSLKTKFDPVLLRLFVQTMMIWTATSHGQTVELF